jgi:hypothetical protein
MVVCLTKLGKGDTPVKIILHIRMCFKETQFVICCYMLTHEGKYGETEDDIYIF